MPMKVRVVHEVRKFNVGLNTAERESDSAVRLATIGRLRQAFPGAAVGYVYEQAVRCGDGGSRRTTLLIGLHRLRPANSEHQ